MKSPFKVTQDEDCTYYTATLIELPNDGTPDSNRFLGIRICDPGDGSYWLDVILETKWNHSIRTLSSQTVSLSTISDILYGVARIKTIQILEPL